jgi:hypothetical protein
VRCYVGGRPLVRLNLGAADCGGRAIAIYDHFGPFFLFQAHSLLCALLYIIIIHLS